MTSSVKPQYRGVSHEWGAYFAAIVLKIQLDDAERPEKPEILYFTLEKSVHLDQSDRTVMCGWTADDSHLNYGDGPDPGVDAFIEAIDKLLETTH